MKPLSKLVIAIPLIIVMVLVAGVMFSRVLGIQKDATPAETATEIPHLIEQTGKPDNTFGETNATSAVGDLTSDLQSTQDDGGTSDFSQMDKQINEL
jgi:hypothetical protein